MDDSKEKPSFIIRPEFHQKFKTNNVKECIHLVLNEVLSGKNYNCDLVPEWSQKIGDGIREKVKDLGFDRYKYVIQTVIGEQRGEAVKMACKCLWDSDTDNYASDIYLSDSIFCVVTVFGSYYY